jgi:hypothetical protein
MQQTFPSSPPLSGARPAANAFPASLAIPTGPVALPTRTHLQRLQFIQATCENQTGQPSLLTVAEARLALRGLDRYFAPLFERRQLSLSEVRETLLWAEEEYGDALLVEDVIQTLVARIGEEQYLRRRQASRRDA